MLPEEPAEIPLIRKTDRPGNIADISSVIQQSLRFRQPERGEITMHRHSIFPAVDPIQIDRRQMCYPGNLLQGDRTVEILIQVFPDL